MIVPQKLYSENIKMEQETRTQFESDLREWQLHLSKPEVQISSDARKFRDCDAYLRIKSLGVNALPHIRETYDKTGDISLDILKVHCLASLVHEIIGSDFQIPEEIRGRMLDIQSYTMKWLDQNISRYSTSAS